MVTFATPLSRALGPKTAGPMQTALGLRTVGDLLRHYPRRYAERGALTPMRELREGDHVTVMAEVSRSSVRTTSTGKQLGQVVVTDGTGTLTLTFFGRTAAYRVKNLPPGRRGLFAGTVSVFNKARQLTHPEVFLGEDDEVKVRAGELIPIYPAAAGLPSWTIATSVRMLLQVVEWGPDPLPEQVRAERDLLPLRTALEQVHEPRSRAQVTAAHARLVWDEAFVLQVLLAQRRAAARALPGTPRVARPDGVLAAFDAALPFALTAGQREVGELLTAELALSCPMHRLLQGEVGSGKTLVALRAMLAVVDAGGQAALLAPTEVLAQQHARSLRALLGPLGTAGELGSAPVATRVALLTGSSGAAARRTALAEVASGEAGLVVGTHALLSEAVEFADLGLVVVDEQHRFGVEQRDALRAKGASPHVLVMTATPIPRTVAMTVFGDLEVSTLTELPSGRAPVETHVVGTATSLARAWDRVREESAKGRRGFVVCPRIGEDGGAEEPTGGDDERRPATAVLDLLPVLRDGPLQGLRVEALHGRLPADDKERVMAAFSAGDLDVLVATTVIEVGVDVPAATVMVVMDADRFGVSQLHQLRGRVGRGAHGGLCLLVTEVAAGSPAGQRLSAVAATSDGFALSQLDLEQRREGDVLGAEQSGTRSSLRLLQLLRDEPVIRAARSLASALVEADPDLDGSPALRAAVAELVDVERADFLQKA